MIQLLDANVLIALADSAHPHRAAALRFFERRAVPEGWATCPLTENAFLRIQGRSGSDRSIGSTREARLVLATLLAAPAHHFWPDDLSLADERLFPVLPPFADLTDIYLLALAVKNGGRFATFDSKIDPAFVPGGVQAFYLIPTA